MEIMPNGLGMTISNTILNTNMKFFLFSFGIVLLFIIFMLLYLVKKRKVLQLDFRSKITENIINSIDSTKSFENNLLGILAVIGGIIEAHSYGFYIIDDKSNSFILKTIRYRSEDDAQIGPSYSGLMPYKKETFFMPSSLPLDYLSKKTEVNKKGEVPLVVMPVKDGRELILIGPVSKVNKKTLKDLDYIGEKMQPLFDILIKTEDLKNQVKVVVSSGRAVKNISSIFTDFRGMLDTIMNLSIKSINAEGGLFLHEEKGRFDLESVIGLDEETEDMLRNDTQTHLLLNNLIGDNSSICLTKKDKEFFKIPPYFVAAEVELLLLVNIVTEKGKSVAAFWYKDNPDIKDYQFAALKMMSKRMADIINNHAKFKELSNSYIEILKLLARLIDNLSVNTVGYSELMYRYAIIIGKQMKLSAKEIKDIALAAYLSNIGVIGLSDELLLKQGKYGEVEYEMMKLHSEVGASIIEATIGNNEIANYIRHHHERMDGYGYPVGLKGEEIPLGSRIIAVIQTFLAKIQSRNYRSAISFEKAIEQLKTSTDSQLDEKVVDALVGWFEKKQKENLGINGPLGPCWEMRCSPENVCVNCPAYKNRSQNCWEQKRNNCADHGNECENCFIYTEYLSRIKKKD